MASTFLQRWLYNGVPSHRLRPNRKYDTGPTKLTNAAAVHSRLLPLISSSGRRRMSTNAAISNATWTAPDSTIPLRWPVLSSLQRLFATVTLLSKDPYPFR
jgi:hypothetical protein